MEIILKSAVTIPQLKGRDKIKKYDGLELHMLKEIENFDLVKTLKPIVNIHYPYENDACNLSKIMQNFDSDNFINFVNYVKKINANIVIHNDLFFMDVLRHPKYFSFIKFIKDNDLIFLLENPANISLRKDITLDIPLICNDFNQKTNKESFFPLLDICHAMMNMNTSVKYIGYDLSRLFREYNSKNFFVHLSSINGDGMNDEHSYRHGLTFDNNKELLKEIILELYSINSKVKLVLEVYEKDYIKAPNANKLKEDILYIKKENKLK